MRRVRACGNLSALTNRLERYRCHNCLIISDLENIVLEFVVSLYLRRESPWRRLHSGEMENGGERVFLMEERENKD